MTSKQNVLDELAINTIRTLTMDAVQKANSGHPGTPMALAPIAHLLYQKVMRHNPANPKWFNRDRFILSAGHASMLQYAALFLAGYDLTVEDLMGFRQWKTKTPGHPEYGQTAGVETTTGPLGQGFMNGIGMAIAEAHLAARFNRPGHDVIDHFVYAICSDGDLMEGSSHEAAALAGHLGLGKLIYFYDDNHITIEGTTDLAYSDDVKRRFEAYHWHVQNLGEKANALAALSRAVKKAQSVTDKPSLIIVRSHIAYGAPNAHDTSESHGAPLGEEEIKLTKQFYGFPPDQKFYVPDDVLQFKKRCLRRGKKLEAEWNAKYDAYRAAHPELAAQLEAALSGKLPEGWDANLPVFKPEDKPIATRSAGAKVIAAIAKSVPWLVGGSADLSPSTRTLIDDNTYFQKGHYEKRNIAWGVRELNMCSSCNGMALHGGIRPYAATFFVFSDYARPAVRLAAIMKLPVIYVFTHDSVGVGEDGPTHQPVEQMTSFRLMPNTVVIRPADANETTQAWRVAMMRNDGPTLLLLTRQNLPILDRSKLAPAEGLLKGAYVLAPESGSRPDVILIASGSEVELCLAAKTKLAESGCDARVVNMPSWELFEAQSAEYRNEVLPPDVTARLAVEAGIPFGWERYIGSVGDIIAINRFGISAPYKEIFKNFGFTVDNVVARAKALCS